MTELEHLQTIVADEGRSAEERKAAAEHILALGQQPTQPIPAQAIVTSTARVSESDAANLAEMKKMLKEIIEDDPRPYLDTHKRCAVCLRHQLKQATHCALCATEGGWEPVTTHHPTWHPIGRGHDSTREHLSNRLTYDGTTDIGHLRWLLTWRQSDGHRHVNAATTLPTPFVLSYEQRLWIKRILEWAEPGTAVQEPTKDELDIAEDQAIPVITVEPQSVRQSLLSRDDMWKYKAWQVEREAMQLPSAVSDWIAAK
jgi:hypothetical protein